MHFRTQNWFDDHATIRRGTYSDASTKLTVLGRRGEILCDATICLTQLGEWPADGNVFIRAYGDTTGVLESLQDAGVIGRTIRIIETGTHTRDPLLRRAVHECRLLNPDA
jgi:hypothetical protein